MNNKYLCCFQLMISGGVDSTVCAMLLKKALPDTEIIAVHVDNGFMRKNESQNVEQLLKKQGINVQGKHNGFITNYS